MIYVMSDIHGQKRRFDSVMKQINLQPEDTLYVLGDVIDRNPDGIKIFVRSWRCQMPKCFWVTTN
jgi:serine/threonine protein phosphatase 1